MRYVNVGPHAISAHPDKTTGVGSDVELTAEQAAPWVDLGFLIERAPPTPPVTKKPDPQPVPQPQPEPSKEQQS